MAKITIELDTNEAGSLSLDNALAHIGFIRRHQRIMVVDAGASSDAYDPNAYKAPAGSTNVVFRDGYAVKGDDGALAGASAAAERIVADADANGVDLGPSPVLVTIPALTDMDGDRKRGEAAPGHRRRTNAQIKDDELWLEQKARAEAALKAMDAGVHDHVEPATIEELQRALAVSTGEERINPEDAADEAAETAARPAGPPTLEDLRAVVALYIDKFGHAASVKNMKTIIGCAVAECPAAEIPNAIAKVRLALDGSVTITPVNPATGRPSAEPETAELFGDKPAAPVTATKADVVAALMAYAAKFDGSQDPEKMPITKEDMPKVFAATFGAGVSGMGSMPDQKPETLGRILTAIQAATEKNTFKREAKS